MNVEYLSKFSRDLDRVTIKSVRKSVVRLIEQLENADKISDIGNVKKLKGFKSAYRIRIGDYRVGVFISGDIVQLGRILHRKDIYKFFP